MQTIKLNISTCPNDTFMFDALVHGKIDCRGLKFDLQMADIEQLNSAALSGYADVTKLSYATYPRIQDRYKILKSGSALGYGSGPLLVSRHKIYPDEMSDAIVALPGEHTTAHKLLNIAHPKVKAKRYYLFSDISEAILSGEVDAGVLIHEERFSYMTKGLSLVTDLGEVWEQKTSLPIPLGAIVIKKDIEHDIALKIENLISESVKYAFANPKESYSFVKQNARELSDEVIDKHIKMFVNDFSINIGDNGKQAVRKLLNTEEDIFI